MVSISKIKAGAARYVDDEITSKLSGWQRWVVGAGAAMALENLDGLIDPIKTHPAAKALHVMDDSGNVDVEKLYPYLKEQAKKGPVTFAVPIIGALTLNESDVDKLYTYIMS